MKVILLRDVAKVGLKNEVKEVSNGYAQNFLIQRGLAEVATAKKIDAAQKHTQARAAQQEADKGALEDGLAKLKGKGLVVRATANEKEHLFEAVSAEVVAAHLKDVVGVAVEADQIVITEPIKELGEHSVHVKVGGSEVKVLLNVESN